MWPSASDAAAVDSIEPGQGLWTLVVRVSLGGFFEIYETALTGLLPVALVAAGIFAKNGRGLFGLPDIASFSFATFGGLFLGALCTSWVSDRVGRRPVFTWSVLWYAAVSLVMLLQSSAAVLCLLRFVAAIGVGASIVTIDAYLAELLPQRLRGRGFAISKSIQYLAIPLTGLIALSTHHAPLHIASWRWLLLLPVVAGGLIFPIVRRLPESPRWLAAHGQAAEVAASTSRGVVAPSAKDPSGTQPFSDLFRAPLARRALMMVVTSCCSTVAYFGFSNWLPSLLEARHVEITKSLLYVTLISLSYPLAPLLISRWADVYERKTQLIAGALLTTVAGLAFAFQHQAIGWLVTGLLVTIGNNISSYAAHTYRSELFPTGLRARAIGFVYSLDRLAAAFSSYLIGFLFIKGGVDWVLACIAGFSFLGMATVALLGPRTVRGEGMGDSMARLQPNSIEGHA